MPVFKIEELSESSGLKCPVFLTIITPILS
jgi:hypothetical protein